MHFHSHNHGGRHMHEHVHPDEHPHRSRTDLPPHGHNTCPDCGVVAVWIRPYMVCRNLACNRLVVA